MKLNDNLINYTLPTSKPDNAKTLVKGTLYDSGNKFWELEAGDEPSKLVNAIEIDWNGADLANATAKWPSGTATINTTGELMGAIKAAYNHYTTYSTATTSSLGLIKAVATSTYSGTISTATGGTYYGLFVNTNTGKAFVNVPASSYTLPTASASVLGGIKLGYTQSGKNYPVQLDSSNKAYVNVPWEAGTGTSSYTLPTASASVLGGVKVAATRSGGVTATSGGSQHLYGVEIDGNGKLFVNVPWTSTSYTLPTASTSALGGVKVANVRTTTITPTTGGTTTGRYYGVELDTNGKAFVNVPWSNTTYGTAAVGSSGLIKAAGVRTTSISSTTGETTNNRYYGVEVDSTGTAFVNIPWVSYAVTGAIQLTTVTGGKQISHKTSALASGTYPTTAQGSGVITSLTVDSMGHITGYSFLTFDELKTVLGTANKIPTAISVSGQSLNPTSIAYGATSTWNKGTVVATYSDSSTGTVTNAANVALTSQDTTKATVSNLIITSIATGTVPITAVYTYTLNGITVSTSSTANLTISKATPTLTIGNPAKTTIADGESTTIAITSSVSGKLTITSSNGTGWNATSSSSSTASTSHTITITNLQSTTTSGTISSGTIKATFTPTNTNYYNTLTNQSVLKQTITLSAAKTLSSITVNNYGLSTSSIVVGAAASWNRGTVVATYSDGTTGTISTGNYTLTVDSSNTSVASVSGTTITGIAAGTSTIRGIYSYTYNGTTKQFTSSTITLTVTNASTYYWYAGTTEPTASNLASINNESLTAKPTTWTASNPKSISATNNSGSSSYIYYCFPTAWNVVVLDSDKISVVTLADVSTFTLNNTQYTVKRTGRTISNGTTKPYYAKC